MKNFKYYAAFWIAIIATLGALLSSEAKADEVQTDYTPHNLNCDRPVDIREPVFARALSIADTYWTKRGYGPEPALRICIVEEQAGMAYAEEGGDTIWLPEFNINWLSERKGEEQHQEALFNLCQNLTHERGHNYGLGHEIWPIMNAELAVHLKDVRNETCYAWSKNPWLSKWRPTMFPPEAS